MVVLVGLIFAACAGSCSRIIADGGQVFLVLSLRSTNRFWPHFCGQLQFVRSSAYLVVTISVWFRQSPVKMASSLQHERKARMYVLIVGRCVYLCFYTDVIGRGTSGYYPETPPGFGAVWFPTYVWDTMCLFVTPG